MDTYRCLVIVQVPPYPLTGGVALRNWQTLNLLKQLGEVAIFSIYKGPAQSSQFLTEQGFGQFHYDIGNPNRSLPEKLKNRLARIRPDGYVYTDWLYTHDGATALKTCLYDFQPTLVIFEELWLYPYLRLVETYTKSTSCAIVLDNHNIEGQKEHYRAQRRHLQQIRYIEGQFAKRVNQVWVCSTADASQLTRLYGTDISTQVIPNSVQDKYYQSVRDARVSQTVDHSLLFLGKFSYAPNEEAALILLKDIYPALQKRYPKAQLWLVGRDPTHKMKAAAQTPNIHITGLVEDVRPYLAQARIMAVPLYQGGGTRLKLLEAFAAHCPVVSTTKGAEGLAVIDTEHLYLRDSVEEMVDAIDAIWQSPNQAAKLTSKAYQLFQAEYSWQATQHRICAALDVLP